MSQNQQCEIKYVSTKQVIPHILGKISVRDNIKTFGYTTNIRDELRLDLNFNKNTHNRTLFH